MDTEQPMDINIQMVEVDIMNCIRKELQMVFQEQNMLEVKKIIPSTVWGHQICHEVYRK